MSNIPHHLRYTQSHEWIEKQPDGTLTLGITDHAQDLLGDVVYIELPQVNQKVQAGESCAVVESVKAASDIYSPVSGEITEINSSLVDQPELVNQDPYGKAWMLRLRPDNPEETERLMDAQAYTELLASEGNP